MTTGVGNKFESRSHQFISRSGSFLTRDVMDARSVVRHRNNDAASVGPWNVVNRQSTLKRTSSFSYFTPGVVRALVMEGSRPKSDVIGSQEFDVAHRRAPVLGPTRQQTEMYLKKSTAFVDYKRHSVATADSDAPSTKQVTSGRSTLVPGDIAIFDDDAANDVLLDAENQIKSGYPTIATSSMVARRNRSSMIDVIESRTDVKFFSELVKPVKYKCKHQKGKVKTLFPSKHGFHQRSQSPTFQRLVGAIDKLQRLATEESESEKSTVTDFLETQSEEVPTILTKHGLRHTRSEPASTFTSVFSEAIPYTKYSNDRTDIRPDVRTIEPVHVRNEQEDEELFYLIEEVVRSNVEGIPSPKHSTSPTPPPNRNQPKQNFKVDFKKGINSHSELHLFLPQIQDCQSRGSTPDCSSTGGNSVKLSLPPITDSNDTFKWQDADRSRGKKRHKVAEVKKKKKSLNRVKSGKEEIKVRDRLNDVPTLISLENDKDFHPASMCVFEHCPHHQYRKSNKIRQA